MYHKATKTIEYFDLSNKCLVKPQANNGYKFELFFHSFLPHVFSGRLGVLQVDRETEFSPVKDADGKSEYTPSTARDQILREATMWLKAVPNIQLGRYAQNKVEVSFLLSYRGESLVDPEIALKLAELNIDGPGYITHLAEFKKTTD